MSPPAPCPGSGTRWFPATASQRRRKRAFSGAQQGAEDLWEAIWWREFILFVCFRGRGGVRPWAVMAAGPGEGVIAGVPRGPFGISKLLQLSQGDTSQCHLWVPKPGLAVRCSSQSILLLPLPQDPGGMLRAVSRSRRLARALPPVLPITGHSNQRGAT